LLRSNAAIAAFVAIVNITVIIAFDSVIIVDTTDVAKSFDFTTIVVNTNSIAITTTNSYVSGL